MIHLGIVITSYLKIQHGARDTIGDARETTLTLQMNNKPSLPIKSVFNNVFILVNTLLYSTHISEEAGFQIGTVLLVNKQCRNVCMCISF